MNINLFNINYFCKRMNTCGKCPFFDKENEKCFLNEEPKNYDLKSIYHGYSRMALMDFGEDLSDEGIY